MQRSIGLLGLTFVAISGILGSGWDTMLHLGICLAIGFLLMIYLGMQNGFDGLDWREALWLIPYLTGLMLLSRLGSFGGGKNVIPLGPDMVAITALGVLVYVLAYRQRLSRE